MARIVIKVGSNLLIDKSGVKKDYIIELVSAIAKLIKDNHKVALVTSGAAASGRKILELHHQNEDLLSKQALCAVGQVKIMGIYEDAFGFYNINVGQLLLTRDDFSDRKRYLNLRNTLIGLENLGVLPIVNENDTIAVEEIKFGDNDILSSMFSVCWGADYLFLMTSVDGVLDTNGRVVVEYNSKETQKSIAKMKKTSFGTGGIDSKIQAGIMASESGVDTYIINGTILENIFRALRGENPGTRFVPPKSKKLPKRLSWIKYLSKPKGKLHINDGAYKAISERKSLLPVGITDVEGRFGKGDVVLLVYKGKIVARGITNYSNIEISKFKGLRTVEIPSDLLYYEEVVHTNNLVLEG